MKNSSYIIGIALTVLSARMAGGQAMQHAGGKEMRMSGGQGTVPGASGQTVAAPRVRVANGELEGAVLASGIRSFKGVPYAAPPVGKLRFREPQPAANWEGVRKADTFAPRPMQLPLFSDMNFRSGGISEDCLYLNVWAPAGKGLPVLVYFFGGGFVAGDGSEYRYDGESLATRGIVTVTVNYRLGVFGFLVHPDLRKESPNHASGNYGLLDQHAALVWVRQNIAAFGGDPARVTIAGESAGSTSVSAQMASPLSKGLFAGAIGESGSLLDSKFVELSDAERMGEALSEKFHCQTLDDLRAVPADQLLADSKLIRYPVVIDGYFLPKSPAAVFSEGSQMSVPLLAGWNSAEADYHFILGKRRPTIENYDSAIRIKYGGDTAERVLALYKASTGEEILQAATDLGSDLRLGYSTWKWIDLQSKTGGKPVYRYFYTHPRPGMAVPAGDGTTGTASAGGMLAGSASAGAAVPDRMIGAGHSWEIEYALGNLPTNKVYQWTAEDSKVSETMEGYFAAFIKTGDPNAPGLPSWPAVKGKEPAVMVIDVNSHAVKDPYAARYRFLDSMKR
jgi:para-nitrobenzyl esterase